MNTKRQFTRMELIPIIEKIFGKVDSFERIQDYLILSLNKKIAIFHPETKNSTEWFLPGKGDFFEISLGYLTIFDDSGKLQIYTLDLKNKTRWFIPNRGYKLRVYGPYIIIPCSDGTSLFYEKDLSEEPIFQKSKSKI